MNTSEKKMVDLLIDLKENHFAESVKAEFETEGSSFEETIRLKEVVSRAGLDLTIKIGGCGALKDIYEARIIGASKLVAPMIESSYALKKFISSIKTAFPKDEYNNTEFLINIETIDGYKNLDKILSVKEINELNGIVIGRLDLAGSLNLTREDVNSSEIFNIAYDIASKAKAKKLNCIIGGSVSAESLNFFKNMPEGALNNYETRKIVFKCPEALGVNAEKGLLKAIEFELMWLKNKRDFYGIIHEGDIQRIEMFEADLNKLVTSE